MPDDDASVKDRPVMMPINYENVIAKWTRILGIATLASFLTSAISALILYKTDLTLNAQSENARTQIRAYVALSQQSTTGILAKKGDADFINTQLYLSFKNYGTTPATILDLWYWSSWFQNSVEPDFTKPPVKLVSALFDTLSAGEETKTGPMNISIDDIKNARANNGRIFVWGQVKYHDIFPDTPIRTLNYCYIISMPLKTSETLDVKRYSNDCNKSD